MSEEHALSGGNTGGQVVRLGDTVRKSWTDNTVAVHAFMSRLRAAGVDVPAVYGRDDAGLRALLPAAMAQRTAAMYELLRLSHDAGREPWASMYTSGHGAHWSAAHRYVQGNRDVWTRALAGGAVLGGPSADVAGSHPAG